MRIAILQFAPEVGKVEENIKRADELVGEAEKAGRLEKLDLLVGPELAFSGYNFPSLEAISPYLEPTACGPTAGWAYHTARRLDCIISIGYPEWTSCNTLLPKRVPAAWTEQSGPIRISKSDYELDQHTTHLIECTSNVERYNSTITVSPTGRILAHYRKSHLYYTDATWASPSPIGFITTELPLSYGEYSDITTKTTFGICMDLNPIAFRPLHQYKYELATHARDTQADLLCASMAWLTRCERAELEEKAQDPDWETVAYWLERLTPLVDRMDQPLKSMTMRDSKRAVCKNRRFVERSETLVVIANRVGIEPGELRACDLEGPFPVPPPAAMMAAGGVSTTTATARVMPGTEPTPANPAADTAQGKTEGSAVDSMVMGSEAKYAGSSCVMGLAGDGNLRLYGVMGRAEEGVLVVDTEGQESAQEYILNKRS